MAGKAAKSAGPDGQRGLRFPGQPLGDIVRAGDIADGRHVADRAAWGTVIDARRPGAGGAVPLPRITLGVIDRAVLGLVVDFHLRVVGAEVALAAGLGLAGFGDGEAVPRVAARTAPEAAVGVLAADADIGPGVRVEDALVDLDGRAVAVVAAGHPLDGVVGAFVHPQVDFPDDRQRVGVLAFGVLGGLGRVAARAIARRDDGADGGLAVLEVDLADIGVGRAGQVAVQAGDARVGVAAVGPVGDDAGAFLGVALDATLGLFADAAVDAVFLQGHGRGFGFGGRLAIPPRRK